MSVLTKDQQQLFDKIGHSLWIVHHAVSLEVSLSLQKALGTDYLQEVCFEPFFVAF